MTIQQLNDASRRVHAASEYLNVAYAELNAAIADRNWSAIDGIRLRAQAALDAQFDAIITLYKMADEEEQRQLGFRK